MTIDQIATLGGLLYGSGWQAKLARDLGVNRQAVVGWMAGTYKPAPDRVAAMVALAERRVQDIIQTIKGLPQAENRP